MEAPHLNLFIEENSLLEGAKEILTVFRPKWNSSATSLKVFTNGITNKLLGCFNSDNENDVVLIRIYGNKTDLLIDRKAETKNIQILHEAGLAPKLFGTFKNGLIYEYVPGEVLTPETCRLEDVFVLVARRLADMHRVNADGLVREPALWKVVRKFIDLVPVEFTDPEKERRFRDRFPDKLNLEKEYVFLEKELRALNSPIVFCHNDLLLNNVIYDSNRSSVTFIDYEYAAYNYQAYDIANHFNEYAGVDEADYTLFPDEDFQKNWIKIYLERYHKDEEEYKKKDISAEEVETLYLKVEKFTLASHFLWGVWCLLQAEYSSIDFDFVHYAFVRLGEYYNRKAKIFSC